MTLILKPPLRFSPNDPDAVAYIAAVEAADGQVLEVGVASAINAFVVGCKADGIWNAIKASCILAGARTLTGALVPLVGTPPTNLNFVAGDYNRKTGLVGNGSNKYLNSNRNNNADPQNNNHNSCWVSTPANGALMAASANFTGRNYMDIVSMNNTRISNRSTTPAEVTGTPLAGLYGHSRTEASAYTYKCPQGSGLYPISSQTTESQNVLIYARNTPPVSSFTSARLSFYSIGEAIDLALLDARVTTLMNALAAAIP